MTVKAVGIRSVSGIQDTKTNKNIDVQTNIIYLLHTVLTVDERHQASETKQGSHQIDLNKL